MPIERIVIDNFKSFRHLDLPLNAHMNLVVGDNEVGKSTLLEAIHAVVTGQLHGRNLAYELTPYLFHQPMVQEYLGALATGTPASPPRISIEAYLGADAALASLRGTNNSLRLDTAGIRLLVELNDDYREEFNAYLQQHQGAVSLPVEYYTVRWYSFANNGVTARSIPFDSTIIDTHGIKTLSGADRYIAGIIEQALTPAQRVSLSLSFRRMRQSFSEEADVAAINAYLTEHTGDISHRALTVGVDTSPRSTWETSLSPYLDELPFIQAGKGEQSAVKMKLAMHAAGAAHVLLIEEPENHLSYSSTTQLIDKIAAHSTAQQVIIATHSSFVLNKLGVDNVILFSAQGQMKLDQLPSDTHDYFMKLPGHDTLRLILAKQAILVEGPSDELIVQRAYSDHHGVAPMAHGVDIISVKSLAFKRFLQIADRLRIQAKVITDNDGDIAVVQERYAEHINAIYYDSDESAPSLEEQLIKANSLAELNTVLGKAFADEVALLKYMKGHKTDTALAIFNSPHSIRFPDYVQRAIT
ncbi:ATP-dependent nuclease [Stenotrophomonas maltophilia]|uniref:ATP-dependent nuclease n=1 Tax=Stenotrophomonas maltophilia TaxID=40324 RepID=UPI0013DB425E|nr:AAA family ATPase [Stenotrophomonas maltophilia]